jgi:hypothetical protein
VSAWRTDDFLVRLPVHPLTVAKDRDALTPSRAQDDPTAAALPVDLLRKHRDTRKPVPPQSPAMRALAPLVAHRWRLVGANVRCTNRLTRALKHDCPQVLHWFPEQETAILCDCLSRWPTLKAVPLARRATLEACFRAPHMRAADVIDPRLQAIKRAIARTTEDGVSTPHVLFVQARIAPLRVTWQAIADFDNASAPRAQDHPDCPWFDALPGAWAVLAPRLLVACGAPRPRFTSAAELPQYAGLAPLTARRGKQSWVPWRLQCPTCLRHTFVAGAAESTRHAFWAQVSDQPPRDQGQAHQAAVRALTFNGIRLLFRCWQERTPSDESVSLQALKRRRAPLLHHLAHGS